MNIPIQNLYYLLLYGWDALEEGELVGITAQPESTILDLLGGVLSNGLDRLLRRGLDRGYIPHTEAIPAIRGRIDISATVKSTVLPWARVVCEFDDLSHDILHNRILRSTVQRLLSVPKLAPELRDQLAATNRRLHEIGKVHLSTRAFRSIQLHGNNRFYVFLIQVCRLIHDSLLVDERTGCVRFRDFVRDERRMRSLFERFACNFYRREQATFDVKRGVSIPWAHEPATPEAAGLMPTMVTDISLVSADRKILIETKFCPEAVQRHYGKVSVRSSHLYQLFAYLKNLAVQGGLNEKAEGILLYPTVGQHLDVAYKVHAHSVRVRTIDLNKDWKEIKSDMLGLLSP